ncbi:hypothetical protein [Nonomuraea basaltis]|uniref:hypothetical protein n=1 Tax=Nonomuraea basaltis TaxID=2495887 RepID=UPI00110C3F50|nr:hypothetical protein [Nonomuraea basaltis]TMR99586.1 hypothetical protein EJK15_07165 [Nonomuraea basaltis]
MRDQLVATGNPTLDAYLVLARGMRHPQCLMQQAERALDRAQQRDRDRNGFGGTAKARQRAERSHDEVKRALDVARRAEDQAEDAAQAAAEGALFMRVADEVEALWDDFYAPRDLQHYRDGDDMPDDPTLWGQLEYGAEVHIRYSTTAQVVVWQFVELGEEHPGNAALRIARYIERSALRGPGCLVELAVHPDDPVGLHARSKHMTIVNPRKEQV